METSSAAGAGDRSSKEVDDVEAALREVERSVALLIDGETVRQTAMHEAAHVVTAWVLGGAVERVTIVPSPSSLGLTTLSGRLPPTEMAVFALIGSLVAGESPRDDEIALEHVGVDGVAEARARARRIAEDHGTAIETVAGRLASSRTMEKAELEALRLELFTLRAAGD